jgi:ABC-type Fe3+/spermidine/putrescine transport system ATPase subunit
VTHDQQEALSMSDRIAVMLDGHVEQLADPDTIYDHPATAFVAGFIGQQNFFEGTARDGGKTVAGDGWSITSALEPMGTTDGQEALAAVRPEAVTLVEQQPSANGNAIAGTLANVSHLGDVIQFVVITGDGRDVLARLPRPRAPRLAVGSEVWCTWDPDHVHVFGAEQAEIVMADPAAEAAPAQA